MNIGLNRSGGIEKFRYFSHGVTFNGNDFPQTKIRIKTERAGLLPRFCLPVVLFERTGGAAAGEGEWRDVAGDDAAGCDDGVTADGNTGKDDGVGAYPDVVFDGDRRGGDALRNYRL